MIKKIKIMLIFLFSIFILNTSCFAASDETDTTNTSQGTYEYLDFSTKFETDYKANQNTHIILECDFSNVSYASWSTILGSDTTNFLLQFNGHIDWNYSFFYGNNVVNRDLVMPQSKVIIDINKGVLTVNNEQVATATKVDFSDSNNLYLNGNPDGKISNFRVYSLTIYDNDKLVHKYKPYCDGTNYGFYDTVTSNFNVVSNSVGRWFFFSSGLPSNGNNSGGNTEDNGGDNKDDNSNWFSNIVNIITNIFNTLGNLANGIAEAIYNIFKPLWDFITNILDWLNPFSENFILLKLWNFLATIIDYLNPFSENFFGKKIVSLIGDLLKALFIPSDNYFDNVKETLLSDIQAKIPYQDYINMFKTILDVGADGQLSDISINNYKVGDLSISVSNFIDFSYITKYRQTWYAWVRGFVFIFLIIFHINQINKFLRGFGVTDGAIYHESSPGGNSRMIGSGNTRMLSGGSTKMIGGGSK